MKLQRYNLGELAKHYASDKDNVVCRAYDVEKLEESHIELLNVLKDLYSLVQGEVPSLLDEDSGGNGYLDVEISNAITKAEGTK